MVVARSVMCTHGVMAPGALEQQDDSKAIGLFMQLQKQQSHRRSLQAPATFSDWAASQGLLHPKGAWGLPCAGNAWLPRAATTEMSCPQLPQLMAFVFPPPFVTGRGISAALLQRERLVGLCPLTCQWDE